MNEIATEDKVRYEFLRVLGLAIRLIAEVADHFCYVRCELRVLRLVAVGDQPFHYWNRSYGSY